MRSVGCSGLLCAVFVFIQYRFCGASACARCLRVFQTINLFICVRLTASAEKRHQRNRVTKYSNIFVFKIECRYRLNSPNRFLSPSVGARVRFSIDFVGVCLCTRWYHQSKRHKPYRFGMINNDSIPSSFGGLLAWMAEWQSKYERRYFCGFSVLENAMRSNFCRTKCAGAAEEYLCHVDIVKFHHEIVRRFGGSATKTRKRCASHREHSESWRCLSISLQANVHQNHACELFAFRAEICISENLFCVLQVQTVQ